MLEPQGYNDEKTVAFYDNEDVSNDPVVGWIVPISGSSKGKSFMLRAGINFIGKEPSVDVLLTDDMNILGRHATVAYDPNSGKFFVSPVTQGALVFLDNQQILATTELKNKQVVTVGNTQLMFVAFCGERFNW